MKTEISNIIIRQAGFNDIESIAEIKVSGWQSAYRGIIDDKYLNAMSISEQIENIRQYPLETIFVAERDNEILAFCRFYDYDKAVYNDQEIDCEIREIYVIPDIKRMGIGSKLFNYVLNYFKRKGKKKMYLGCYEKNDNARKFYEKMGGITESGKDIRIGGKAYPVVSYVYNLKKKNPQN